MTTIYNYNYNSNKDFKPTSVLEFISNKKNDVHNQLFYEALTVFVKDKYNKTLSDFLEIYKVIEKPSINYWEPSYIRIIRKINNIIKEAPKEEYLGNYWNPYPYLELTSKTIYDTEIGNIDLSNCEIIYNDYYNAYSILKNKINGKEYRIPFKYINKDVKISDDLSLKDTFGYQIYND